MAKKRKLSPARLRFTLGETRGVALSDPKKSMSHYIDAVGVYRLLVGEDRVRVRRLAPKDHPAKQRASLALSPEAGEALRRPRRAARWADRPWPRSVQRTVVLSL